MPEAPASVWQRLASRSEPAGQPGGDGVWDALKNSLNAALARPQRSPDVMSVPFVSREDRPYHILTNPHRYTYLRLGPEEHHLWSLMDGSRTVKDLVIEHFTQFGVLAFGLIGQLVAQLKLASMLTEKPVHAFAAVARALERRGRSAPRLVWEVITGQRKFMIRRVDGLVEWLYEHGGWVLYTWPIQIFYVAVSIIGGWLFVTQLLSGRYGLLQAGGSYAKGLLLLYGLNYASIAIHEMAHAITCKHYGARVNGAGVMLYFGLPAYYVDTTDIWTKPARARIATSWAGPYSGLILAGVCSLLVAAFPNSPASPILHRLAFLMILLLVFNLIPLLELDGYFMLIDKLEIPMLRAKALAFVRRELWAKIRRRERFTGHERLLGWFGVFSILFSGFVIFLALQFWRRRLGPVARELWAGGTGGRIALALFLLVFTFPLITGLFGRAVTAGRSAAGWVRRRVTRPGRRTLLDRDALLRRVRFLSPLQDELRAEVAALMQRAAFRPGEAVVTEGEPGDRFYVIASGAAEVTIQGSARPGGILGAGDYFGEIALLHRVPRTATVRAMTPLEVLWLRKGDFDRLLASSVEVSVRIDQALNMVERLRGFPIFAVLSPAELDELATRLTRETFPAGATVVAAGDRGDAFYLIDAGQAEAVAGGRRLRLLGRGDYFGEIALVLDVPRTATVRAMTPLDVFRLDRGDFEALVQTTLAKIASSVTAGGATRWEEWTAG